jgi:hypothetical protein
VFGRRGLEVSRQVNYRLELSREAQKKARTTKDYNSLASQYLSKSRETDSLRPVKFKAAFCSHFGYTPAEYPSKLFWMTLYPHARLAALILHPLWPRFFRTDHDLIADIGETEHPVMFRDEVDIFHGNNKREGSFLRNKLYFRISGSRMIRIGETVLGVKLR